MTCYCLLVTLHQYGISALVPQIRGKQESPKGYFNWAANFVGGGGGCKHSGHYACRWPLRGIASHVRDIYSFEHCTLLEDFRNQKNEYHFHKSGPYSAFSNSNIMNKNKKVNHSKQETISVICPHTSISSRISSHFGLHGWKTDPGLEILRALLLAVTSLWPHKVGSRGEIYSARWKLMPISDQAKYFVL